MALYQLGEHIPQIHETAHIADSADVIGQVEMAEHRSVWYGVVVRADTDRIRIGRGSNIQDNTVLHTDAGIELVIGENVTVGHQCMLHGCSIGDGSLIGIQSVVLNGARIGRNCLVGSGALVTEGKEFPDGWLILGTPAKAARPLTPEQLESLLRGAAHYVRNAQRFRAGLVRLR